MGSAFPAEPWVRALGLEDEVVLHALADPDLVAHFAHPECQIECPHPMASCGRYAHTSPTSPTSRNEIDPKS
jgi:hypothetical protein